MNLSAIDRLAEPSGIDVPVLLVVAHPDDETIGAGGILPRLREASLVCVTDGSPAKLHDARRAGCTTRQHYASRRAAELHRAVSLAGIPPQRVQMLKIADQQASLHMRAIADRLAGQVQRLQPALLITHAYEGGHPDHDATALAVHAMQLLLQAQRLPCPEIVEMACYHGAGGRFTPHHFLPRRGGSSVVVALSPHEQARKRRMIACHASQQHVLAQFGLQREVFRAAAAVRDFYQPPHPGRLWYERFDWGMTGPRWRRLAAAALRELTPCAGVT